MKYLIGLLIVGILLISGCLQQGEPIPPGEPWPNSEERMFVETQINPLTPEWSNLQKRPMGYGFLLDKELVIKFMATKYIGNTDGLMSIKINLPEGFEIVNGVAEWQGTDVSKTIDLKLKPKKEGRYEIEMIATNTANNFTTKGKIIACVGKEVKETTSYCPDMMEYVSIDGPVGPENHRLCQKIH